MSDDEVDALCHYSWIAYLTLESNVNPLEILLFFYQDGLAADRWEAAEGLLVGIAAKPRI